MRWHIMRWKGGTYLVYLPKGTTTENLKEVKLIEFTALLLLSQNARRPARHYMIHYCLKVAHLWLIPLIMDIVWVPSLRLWSLVKDTFHLSSLLLVLLPRLFHSDWFVYCWYWNSPFWYYYLQIRFWLDTYCCPNRSLQRELIFYKTLWRFPALFKGHSCFTNASVIKSLFSRFSRSDLNCLLPFGAASAN